MVYQSKKIASPIGNLILRATSCGLIGIHWEGRPYRENLKQPVEKIPVSGKGFDPVLLLNETEQQLAAYFNGKLRSFDLPLDLSGSEFQKKVWKALVNIPIGEIRSYKAIALEIGHPKAVRAVGLANSKNPIPIVVPCHRVIGSDGRLIGFSGGSGLETKRFLLASEARWNEKGKSV